MLSIVFPFSHEQLVSFVLALLVPSSSSHQVYRIICWPLSVCPSYFHDTVFRSIWNPDLVPWVPSLPQDCRFIKVMLFNLSLLLILLLKHQRVMWTKLGIYLSFCVFLFLSNIVVQLLSCVPLFETPWTAARKVFLFFTISRSLLKLMSIEPVMPSNHLIAGCLLSPSPPAFNLSQHQGLF